MSGTVHNSRGPLLRPTQGGEVDPGEAGGSGNRSRMERLARAFDFGERAGGPSALQGVVRTQPLGVARISFTIDPDVQSAESAKHYLVDAVRFLPIAEPTNGFDIQDRLQRLRLSPARAGSPFGETRKDVPGEVILYWPPQEPLLLFERPSRVMVAVYLTKTIAHEVRHEILSELLSSGLPVAKSPGLTLPNELCSWDEKPEAHVQLEETLLRCQDVAMMGELVGLILSPGTRIDDSEKRIFLEDSRQELVDTRKAHAKLVSEEGRRHFSERGQALLDEHGELLAAAGVKISRACVR